MLKTIDSRLIPPADRVEAIFEQGRKDVLPVDSDFGGNDPVAIGAVLELGQMRLSNYVTTAVQAGRTQRRSGDDYPPSVMLALQMRGSSLLVQDGRESVIRPGDLCVYRSDAQYWLRDPEGYRNGQVLLPVDSLAMPGGVLQHLTAVRLCPGDPLADVAAAYFHRLVSRLPSLDVPSADRLIAPSVELLRAVLSTHLNDGGLDARNAAHLTLQLRTMEYVRAHLSDPGLSAEQIAAAHHISVRQLYKILAAAEISLGDWVRRRRLEAARAELDAPGARQMSITTVARKCGFSDPSTFSRAFRAEYGTTPREWRDRARTPPDADIEKLNV